MSNVTELRIVEKARLDRRRLQGLYDELGPHGAEALIGRAMEELAVGLGKVGRAWKQGELQELLRATEGVRAISAQVGMCNLERIALDVLTLAKGLDAPAFAATVARLCRTGERSLLAVWDLQDLSI